jgi:hypothetical protein
MNSSMSGKLAELRGLAAQMRCHARETGLKMYQRKFEGMAAELEEAARDVESRALQEGSIARLRERETGREYNC